MLPDSGKRVVAARVGLHGWRRVVGLYEIEFNFNFNFNFKFKTISPRASRFALAGDLLFTVA
ncbi:MAG: hypothetical protein R6V61_00180 [Wenzhouxiangellaceae bacterium]